MRHAKIIYRCSCCGSETSTSVEMIEEFDETLESGFNRAPTDIGTHRCQPEHVSSLRTLCQTLCSQGMPMHTVGLFQKIGACYYDKKEKS